MNRFFQTFKHIFQFQKPRNDRNWSLDLSILPEIHFLDTHTVSIKNIRNCTYRSTTDYTLGFYDRTILIEDIETVWFMVEPFSLFAAHTLVSFGLRDGTYIAISVEIRKIVGQKFSQLMVLFFLRRHELVYVIGDEKDLLKLRTNYRKDTVYLYQTNASKEHAQELFTHMVRRAQKLQKTPEFYNPFTNTCLTNIVNHVNTILPKRIPFSYEILIATLSDAYAYKIGLLDQKFPFRILKQKSCINERALQSDTDPNFSQKIRQNY